ncbi:hypothetical protein RFI_24692 [Reticulomyxa filosa]|uniref:Uncharacterized protein n=1 Tax=Reticulomyxa filosa TaxID=46433 RepID=X6MF86_RETFI|nr:hypothetical protein RFI_24692 [Reticulomyxa filosa]|eukprot:ETO12683.1 hypothetical protein RFI_24692 [Reticulomyxa filosa]
MFNCFLLLSNLFPHFKQFTLGGKKNPKPTNTPKKSPGNLLTKRKQRGKKKKGRPKKDSITHKQSKVSHKKFNTPMEKYSTHIHTFYAYPQEIFNKKSTPNPAHVKKKVAPSHRDYNKADWSTQHRPTKERASQTIFLIDLFFHLFICLPCFFLKKKEKPHTNKKKITNNDDKKKNTT